MSGMDFSLSDLVQSTAGVGNAFQQGLATAQQQQDRQMKLAALQRASPKYPWMARSIGISP